MYTLHSFLNEAVDGAHTSFILALSSSCSSEKFSIHSHQMWQQYRHPLLLSTLMSPLLWYFYPHPSVPIIMCLRHPDNDSTEGLNSVDVMRIQMIPKWSENKVWWSNGMTISWLPGFVLLSSRVPEKPIPHILLSTIHLILLLSSQLQMPRQNFCIIFCPWTWVMWRSQEAD